MFPAIETSAQMRTPLVDGAPCVAEIDALAPFVRGQNEDGLAVLTMTRNRVLVGFHIVSQFGVQNQALTAPATFGASSTRNLGVFFRHAFSV
jgi:hypothetical protein